MPSYFKLVSAVVVGISLFFVIVGGVLYLSWGGDPKVEKGSILHEHIAQGLLEYPAGGYTSGLIVSGQPSLHSILDNLNKAATDDRIRGVLLTFSQTHAGFGMLDEIRAGIAKVRKAGKPVWAWSDDFSLRELYVAAACDSFLIHPVGYVYLGGIHADHEYLTGTLNKLGIQAQVDKIERYKSAAEMVTRTDMSPEAREMTGWLLSDVYPRVLEGIAEGFGLERRDVEAALTHTIPLAQDVVDMGLASGIRYWDEMTQALPRPGGKDDAVFIEGADYAQVPAVKVGLKGKKKIAVVHAQGLIAGNTSGLDPVFGMRMGHESVNRDLRRALKDKDVAAVVFRVDSRGGSSLTSDRISRMVEVVDRKKPVVVSMVDVAASGGYTISYRARKIVAGPNTITGSIGSITGKFVLKDLYNKLGVTRDGVGIGPRSDFFSDYRPWTESELEDVKAEHWAQYRAWIARIAAHRGKTVEEVDAVARGRVWTGSQALERGLVDALGTLDTAIAAAKEAAGLGPDAGVTVVHYPQPEGFLSTLIGMDLTTVPGAIIDGWISERTAGVQAVLSDPGLELMAVPVP